MLRNLAYSSLSAGTAALLHRPRAPESLADALTRMLADAALRAKLAEAGRRHVSEHFELRQLLDQYVELITNVSGVRL